MKSEKIKKKSDNVNTSDNSKIVPLKRSMKKKRVNKIVEKKLLKKEENIRRSSTGRKINKPHRMNL